MRVIFMDFDGVLHRAGDGTETVVRFQWLHVLVQLLEPWPDVHLAVHSTWRYLHTPMELRSLLGPLSGRFIGAVPRGPRAESIRWFLHLNPDITRYLVLDDAPREFPPDFPGELLLCDSRNGISAPEVQVRLRAWLEGAAS